MNKIPTLKKKFNCLIKHYNYLQQLHLLKWLKYVPTIFAKEKKFTYKFFFVSDSIKCCQYLTNISTKNKLITDITQK